MIAWPQARQKPKTLPTTNKTGGAWRNFRCKPAATSKPQRNGQPPNKFIPGDEFCSLSDGGICVISLFRAATNTTATFIMKDYDTFFFALLRCASRASSFRFLWYVAVLNLFRSLSRLPSNAGATVARSCGMVAGPFSFFPR